MSKSKKKWNCNSRCPYWNKEEGNCGAFECNGLECPKLPCEEDDEEENDD